MITDYPRHSVITSVLTGVNQEEQSQRRRCDDASRGQNDMKKGSQAKELGDLQKMEKAKKRISP